MFYIKYDGWRDRYTECTGNCSDCIDAQLINNSGDKVDRNGKSQQENKSNRISSVKQRGKNPLKQ